MSANAGMDRFDDARRPLDVMCDDIVTRYHAALHRAMPRIRQGVAAFSAEATSPAAREMCEVFTQLAQQIDSHFAKEENLVFPALAALSQTERPPFLRPRLTFATVLHPIRLLEAEHLSIERTLDRLLQLAPLVVEPGGGSELFQQCMSELAELDRRLRELHRVENEVLFPRALEIERQAL
jgi:regulator of cell morphogenesis and NO signaling